MKENFQPIADVRLCCGRLVLYVAEMALAMEGDACRMSLPEEVCEKIPQQELDQASIGGIPANNLSMNVVRFFRGDRWTGEGLHWVADKINAYAIESSRELKQTQSQAISEKARKGSGNETQNQNNIQANN